MLKVILHTSLSKSICVCVCVCVWQLWSLNSGFPTCQAGALLFEPHLQPLCFGYFGDRVLHFDQVGLDHSPPIAIDGMTDACPAFFCWHGVSLTWNYDLSCVAWDYRCEPLCPAIGWDRVSWIICPYLFQTSFFPISASQVARMSHQDPEANPLLNAFCVISKFYCHIHNCNKRSLCFCKLTLLFWG
jgi:hypothetical protein